MVCWGAHVTLGHDGGWLKFKEFLGPAGNHTKGTKLLPCFVVFIGCEKERDEGLSFYVDICVRKRSCCGR